MAVFILGMNNYLSRTNYPLETDKSSGCKSRVQMNFGAICLVYQQTNFGPKFN